MRVMCVRVESFRRANRNDQKLLTVAKIGLALHGPMPLRRAWEMLLRTTRPTSSGGWYALIGFSLQIPESSADPAAEAVRALQRWCDGQLLWHRNDGSLIFFISLPAGLPAPSQLDRPGFTKQTKRRATPYPPRVAQLHPPAGTAGVMSWAE